jgi:hypothetical protein
VASCAITYRLYNEVVRVKSYAPLASYLELPELGYALPPHRVTEIATEVCRAFATPDGAAHYPATYSGLPYEAPLLLARHFERQS